MEILFLGKKTTKQTKNGQFFGKSQVWSRKLTMTRKKLDLTKKFQFFFFLLHKTARLLVWWRFAIIYCFALSKIDILRDVIQYMVRISWNVLKFPKKCVLSHFLCTGQNFWNFLKSGNFLKNHISTFWLQYSPEWPIKAVFRQKSAQNFNFYILWFWLFFWN